MSSDRDSADRLRYAELKALFSDALERPPEDWPALLATLRQRDADLADGLQRLLDGHREVFLDVDARDPQELQPGAAIGPYVIAGLIGEGGMGRVYRAKDARLGRDVAIKVLPPELAHDSARRVRMEREARAMGMLNHPNIVTVYDIGDHRGSPFIVSELLEGQTLRARATGDGGAGVPLDADEAIGIVAAVAAALGAAHARGIVHRDVKPENVFLTRDGRIKVLDFGIAKLLDGDGAGEATATGAIIGTVGYITPEQLRGETAGPPADVYACGVVLYELLAGVRPFAGKSQPALIAAILQQPAPPLTGVPSAVGALVARCLAKEPEARFPNGAALAGELHALRAAVADAVLDPREQPTERLGGSAQPEGGPATATPVWRRPLVAAAAVLVIVAIALGAVWRQRRPGGPTETTSVTRQPDPAPTPPASSSAVVPELRPDDSPRPSTAPGSGSPSSRPEPSAALPPRREPDATTAAKPAPEPAAPQPTAPQPTAPPLPSPPSGDGVWAFREEAFEDAHAITCSASGALQLRNADGVLDGTLRLKQECTDAKRTTPESTEAVAALTAGTMSGDAVSFVTRTVDDGVATTCQYDGRIVGAARAAMAGSVSCKVGSAGVSSQLTLRGTWRATRTSP